MTKNKILMVGVPIMVLVFGITVVGCVSFSHTQAVRNETGYTVTEVYIRDTGTTEWGSVKNVQARRDAQGIIIYNRTPLGYGEVAYWDRVDMNNTTQLVLFNDSNSSETPDEIHNKDIKVIDSNNLVYMKLNVPITFTTTKSTNYILISGADEVVSKSDPITFTDKDRLPMLFIVNQTGFPITISTPAQGAIANGARTSWQNVNQIPNIPVTYVIGHVRYAEQVTMNNVDTTVTLTKRPPFVTIENTTGNTVNVVMMRNPGTGWTGPNILNLQLSADGTLTTTQAGQAGVTTTELRGSITNRDNFRFWTGNVELNPGTYDIRLDDVQGNSYVKDNVQITGDMTLTFSQSDKR